MSKKSAKHPRTMTTDEAVKHLFHPHVLKHANKALTATGAKKKTTKK
jgi:hypothetical protein